MARHLEQEEIERLLRHVSTKRYALRDKAILLLCLYSGLSVKEVVQLEICQLLTSDAQITQRLHLSGTRTRRQIPRTVFINKLTQRAIKDYLCARFESLDLLPVLLTDTKRVVFVTQKCSQRGFSANTLAGYIGQLMREAGLSRASSMSLQKTYTQRIATRVLTARIRSSIGEGRVLAQIANRIASNPTALKLALAY